MSRDNNAENGSGGGAKPSAAPIEKLTEAQLQQLLSFVFTMGSATSNAIRSAALPDQLELNQTSLGLEPYMLSQQTQAQLSLFSLLAIHPFTANPIFAPNHTPDFAPQRPSTPPPARPLTNQEKVYSLFGLNMDKVPERFLDPLTALIINDPVLDPNHLQITYDRESICRWLAKEHSNPYTRKLLRPADLKRDTVWQKEFDHFIKRARVCSVLHSVLTQPVQEAEAPPSIFDID